MREIQIYEEENSVVIEDDFNTNDFVIYPKEKKFTVSGSIKNDVFYNNQVIEYKISTDPIELYMRTLESSSEPPLEYDIKDGVVLESEIKKRRGELFGFGDRLESLKKQVEWSKIPVFNAPELNLYILSRHPELISKDEYRKFLRQSLERIKMGIIKIDEAIKNDRTEIQIHTSEYGKNIWYPDSEEEQKESEEYWDLPSGKREESNYSKKIEYIEKFTALLFDENSLKYVGLTEHEFKSSTEIVEYLENLLTNKNPYVVIENTESITKKPNNKIKWIVVISLSIIALSWGIWTAIGVFILGIIIINLLKS